MTATPAAADWLADALGNVPFPWQVRLLERFLAGDPPRHLDIPTGLGKTAVMAAWLVARVTAPDRSAGCVVNASMSQGLRATSIPPSRGASIC